MKKVFSILIVVLFFCFACNRKHQSVYEINGTLSGIKSGKMYLQKFYNKMFFTIDTAIVTDGKFHFDGKFQVPELYGLTNDTTKYPLFVFIEKGDNISIEFDSADFNKSKFMNSLANDLYREFKNLKGEPKIDSFIQKHPKSIVAAYLLYREYSYKLSPEDLEKYTALLDTSLNNTQYVIVLKELSGIVRSVLPGNNAKDFSLPDTTGKEVKLSSLYGKYLLLDFWASWCGPCRRENPNVVKMFNLYKDKGFDVIGVSLDKDKDNWLKAINKDKLTWTHVSALKYWNCPVVKLYGVRAIPSNILIDPKGVIIGRNLTGEKLSNKLKEIFEKK